MKTGHVYLFKYDPKTKDILPIYDTVPYVFVMERYRRGFLALNLHYVPIRDRIAFLKIILSQMQRTKKGNLKLTATYPFIRQLILKANTDKMIKRYLNSHLRSEIKEIETNNWIRVASLPLERFVRKR